MSFIFERNPKCERVRMKKGLKVTTLKLKDFKHLKIRHFSAGPFTIIIYVNSEVVSTHFVSTTACPHRAELLGVLALSLYSCCPPYFDSAEEIW